MRRILLLAAVLVSSSAAAQDMRVHAGHLVIRSFDEYRIMAAIDVPEQPGRASRDQIFLYHGLAPTGVSLLATDTTGRVIVTRRGYVVVAPEKKLALVLSLDEPADEGLHLGFVESGYEVIRLNGASGLKQLGGYAVPFERYAAPTTTFDEECPECAPRNDDWGLGGGGNSNLCQAGGSGSTSCSYTCRNGTSCTATCGAGKFSCCWCDAKGDAICRCI